MFFYCHLFLNALEITVGSVGLLKIFLLKLLHFVLPHPKDLSIDADVVPRLRIAPECLIVTAVETAETTAKHGFDNDWDRHTLLFAQNLPFIES